MKDNEMAQQKHSVDLGEEFAEMWCRLMHTSPRWPIHGQYECGTCMRRFPVPWANEGSELARVIPATYQGSREGLRV